MYLHLKELRTTRHLTQQQVATATGISIKRLSTYENQTREPDIETLVILADFFGVTLDELTRRKAAYFDQPPGVPLNLQKFGERIKEFRIQRGMDKESLAKAAHISPAYLTVLESGAKLPGLETCLRLLNALEASADAAFMDSLDVGWKVKTNYLSFTLSSFPSEIRNHLLDFLEVLIKSYLPSPPPAPSWEETTPRISDPPTQPNSTE